MGIDVSLEDERGEVLERVDDAGNDFAHFLAAADLSKTACLRFVDPYGDAVYNQLQLPVLVAELETLARRPGTPVLLARVIDLARRSAGQVHTYLRFCGD